MLKEIFLKLDSWTIRSVILPGDDNETLLRKKIWWGLTIIWIIFNIVDISSSIPLRHFHVILVDSIDLLICLTLLVTFYYYRRRIEVFGLILQLALILFPSIKVYLFGGIFNATGIATAALIAPVYALTFPNYRRAILIYFIYLGSILSVTIFRQYQLHPELTQFKIFYYPIIRYTGGLDVIFFIFLVYSLQIAKLKRLEEERLIQLNRTKSKLYTNITHEFRTPLTIIMGMADKLEEDPAGLVKRGTNLIKSNARKLLKLVNQLMSMSKMEADAMPVNMIQTDIIPFLKYIIESFHSIAEVKNIRLHFLSNVDIIKMDFDPDIIEDILGNLLSNAIKFTNDGGNIYIQSALQSGGNGETTEKLILKIKDTGIGIDPKKLSNIFDRFYQADDESTRKAEGTGIGLALVKEYITLLKGSIDVKSKTGKGTEFLISIPVSRTAPIQVLNLDSKNRQLKPIDGLAESVTKNISENEVDSSGDNPLVLIVEDNEDVVEYVNMVLNSDYRTEVAENGIVGIDLALKIIPDLIICDVMMPEKDGYEVCKTLKEDFRTNHIPIIMLTAKADIDSKINGLEFGADAYIIKPFNKEELLVRIRKLIENRKTLKEKYSDIVYSSFNGKKPKGLNEIFLQKLFENLEKNYHDEDYSIDRLCVDAGVSRAQLHRKLIALTGKSTSDFIRCYRITKAKEVLLTSDKTIAEIAYQVGFKDPNYFTKSFIKEVGMSPTQFRSNNAIVQQ